MRNENKIAQLKKKFLTHTNTKNTNTSKILFVVVVKQFFFHTKFRQMRNIRCVTRLSSKLSLISTEFEPEFPILMSYNLIYVATSRIQHVSIDIILLLKRNSLSNMGHEKIRKI